MEEGSGGGAARSEILQTIQRDINGLSDADRNVRRRSLEALSKKLLQSNIDPLLLQDIVCSSVLPSAVRLFSDAVEKCRELAIGLVTDVASLMPSVEMLLPAVMPVIRQRMGSTPVLEPSEEIRLQLMQLVGDVLPKRDAGALQGFMDDVASIMCRSLLDTYHEIKKASCHGLVRIATTVPASAVEAHSAALVKALLTNVSHQHHRVRVAILEALTAIVPCGLPAGFMKEILAPGIRPLAFDRSLPVREAFFQAVARWLGGGNPGGAANTHVPALLPLLLLGITDDSSSIASETLCQTEAIADVWVQAQNEMQTSTSKVEYAAQRNGVAYSASLPAPFGDWHGHRKTTQMVTSFFSELLQPALEELKLWTAAGRLGAARLLYTLLVFAESHSTTKLDVLIPPLCSAISDDDVAVAQRVVSCMHVIGHFTPAESWMPLVLDAAGSKSTTTQRANSLVMLAALLQSCPPDRFSTSCLEQVAEACTSSDLRSSDHPAVRNQLLLVINNVIRLAQGRCQPVAGLLFHALLQLQSAGAENPQLAAGASSAITQLAQATHTNPEALCSTHMSALLDEAITDHSEWSGQSPGALLFEALLQQTGSSLQDHMDKVLMVFRDCLHADKDPALRIRLLRLLDRLFESDAHASALRAHAVEVLLELLAPAAVWKVGKSAAAVRYATMVALGTYFRRRLCDRDQLQQALASEQVLPVLTSCMEEDFYADTRRASCHAMEQLLLVAGAVLTDEQRRAIYPELLKRMDDSSDAIRLLATACVYAFLQGMPAAYDDTNTRYLLNGFLVHMDDRDPNIQQAVCQAVTVAAEKKPVLVAGAVNAVKSKHRTSKYCDQLLAACAAVQPEQLSAR
eukprot:jgi/Chlat1/432/Chrsp103S00944